MLVNKHPKHTRARQARPTLALLPGWNRVLTRTLSRAVRWGALVDVGKTPLAVARGSVGAGRRGEYPARCRSGLGEGAGTWGIHRSLSLGGRWGAGRRGE